MNQAKESRIIDNVRLLDWGPTAHGLGEITAPVVACVCPWHKHETSDVTAVEIVRDHDGTDSPLHHNWPTDDGHVWGPWHVEQAREGTKVAVQYRTCVHPACRTVERREAPRA